MGESFGPGLSIGGSLLGGLLGISATGGGGGGGSSIWITVVPALPDGGAPPDLTAVAVVIAVTNALPAFAAVDTAS